MFLCLVLVSFLSLPVHDLSSPGVNIGPSLKTLTMSSSSPVHAILMLLLDRVEILLTTLTLIGKASSAMEAISVTLGAPMISPISRLILKSLIKRATARSSAALIWCTLGCSTRVWIAKYIRLLFPVSVKSSLKRIACRTLMMLAFEQMMSLGQSKIFFLSTFTIPLPYYLYYLFAFFLFSATMTFPFIFNTVMQVFP